MDNSLDSVENRARYFASTAALSFLAEANSIIERSKDRKKAKGLRDKNGLMISFACRAVTSTAALVVGGVIGGPAGAISVGKLGNTTGGVASFALKSTFHYCFQVKDHRQCKEIHKRYLTSFRPSEQLQNLVAFFYDVFTNYNVQFNGMLKNLKDSWENAMNKLAMDSVNRQEILSTIVPSLIQYPANTRAKDVKTLRVFSAKFYLPGLMNTGFGTY